MTLYAGTQQSVTDAEIGYAGDFYGQPETWLPTHGALASEVIGIGTFCWGVTGGNLVAQAKGSNTQLAGFVIRSQATGFGGADTNVGYSYAVPIGQNVSYAAKGNLYAPIGVSYNVGNVINVGDLIYIDNVTGALAVGVTIEPGYTVTDFAVVINSVPSATQTNLVVISNQNTFLGKGY